MSASNSISQLLEQFLELNTNSLETFNRINEAITTDKETVVIDLFNNKSGQMETIQIPAFGYLKSEIERLNKNMASISGIGGANANVRLKDGSYRKIHTSRLKGPSKSITSLAAPTEFSTKLNEFFEDFLNPLLTVNLDVSGQIPVETERVYIERYILNNDDAATIEFFDDNLKGGSEIAYSNFKDNISTENLKYYLDSEVVDMPIRDVQYTGAFDVVKIDSTQRTVTIDGSTQTKTIKLYTLNKLSYTDSSKSLNDTEALKVGDSLIINSGNYSTRYLVKSIDNSTTQIELQLLEGFESIKIGVNQLGIYKDLDTNIEIEVKVGYDERQIVFVKPIDPISNVPAENFSPGIGFFSNELVILDSEGDKKNLAEYYRDEVSDFGQFIKSLKVDYIPPAGSGIIPDSPVINESNFKVVQINKHLTNNTTVAKIKQLKSDKISVEQNLKQLDEVIKQKKAVLNTKKFESSTERDSQKSELSSLINERDSESKLFASIVTEIKAAAESVDLAKVSPKFRVRGFWSIPNAKKLGDGVSQEVVQFKIRYRYVSTSGKTSEVEQMKFTDDNNQSEKTAAFSNWVESNGPVRKRELNDAGVYKWVVESEEDAQAVNFNSLDIAISSGEIVEIMVKSLSEAGFPANPVTSDWSEITRIEFPEGELSTDAISDILGVNNFDNLKVQVDQDLESKGVYTHVSDSFTTSDKYFAHNAASVASGFTTEGLAPLSVYEKLLSLQNEVLRLRGIIEDEVGELVVKIIDEDGSATPITNNTRVKLFAGYYVDEIPTEDFKGSIVTKNFRIDVSNTKASDLELISRVIGDTTKEVYASTTYNPFGIPNIDNSGNISGSVNTSPLDAAVINDAYYTNEAQYDLAPIVYQNILTQDQNIYSNPGPEQSMQLRGQWIYARYKNLANDGRHYVSTDDGSYGDIDLLDTSGYDQYGYGISYNYSTLLPTTTGGKNYSAATDIPFSATNGVDDFIWSGTFSAAVSGGGINIDTTNLGGSQSNVVTYNEYSNGIFLHKDHPLLEGQGASYIANYGTSSQEHPILDIQSNGLVGIPKTAVRRSTDSYGKMQTPIRFTRTINNEGNAGIRLTSNNSFQPEDKYLLGGHSCGSFLYLSPLNEKDIVVDAVNKSGKKIVPGGSKNSISIDLVFQYRMTDYYGVNPGETGRIGGIVNNKFTNLVYSKIIGIDIFDKAGNEFKFDVEVYAQYKAGGKNINNITKSMLTSYNANSTIASGFAGGGRRRYLSELNDFSLPEIDNF
jgi:hypothetical protein